MNRLQKKCAIATVGFHLLLLVILIVGPGFFAPKPKADDLQILDVIPANLIDAAFSSGVRNAQPPPPAPVVTPPQPAPPAPQPVVTLPPAPPKVETPEPVKPIVKALTPEPKPVEKPKIQINTQLVTRTTPKNSPKASPRDDSQEKARALALAARNAARSLKNSFTPAMTVDMPGNSSVAYANYAAVVKSRYEQAWQPPDDAQNDEANVKVTVTIASDGTVVSARVLTPSGDAGVDASVQHTLDRVTFIAPFPEGTTEKERTYTINFNLKAKRSLG